MELNDPFEFRVLRSPVKDVGEAFEIALELQKWEAPELTRHSPAWEEWVHDLAANLLCERSENNLPIPTFFPIKTAGVFCMCQSDKDIRMWSHYADAHQGVCIGLSTSVIRKKSRLLRVHYCDDMPELSMKETLIGDRASILPYICKSKSWQHEAEWRCFEEQAGPVAFPAEVISLVIFGARIAPARKQRLLSIIQNYEHEVTLLDAILSKSSYCLEFQPYRA